MCVRWLVINLAVKSTFVKAKQKAKGPKSVDLSAKGRQNAGIKNQETSSLIQVGAIGRIKESWQKQAGTRQKSKTPKAPTKLKQESRKQETKPHKHTCTQIPETKTIKGTRLNRHKGNESQLENINYLNKVKTNYTHNQETKLSK